MKKKMAIAAVILTILAVAFVPVPTTHSISGNGDILTRQKEKTGTCELEIEIKEISSPAICYKRSFSFAIDGKTSEPFLAASYSEADEICLLSQMYYDAEADEMRLCSLLYQKDLSYAVLDLGSNYYFINNGSDMAYAELPIA